MSKALETETEPETRLRRLPCVVTETGLAVITRAITLRLATFGETGSNDPELYGETLSGIVGEWLTSEATRLRASRGEP